MRVVLLRRALKIYGCQAALLLFLFTTVAALGALAQQSAVTDLLSFYRMRPKAAVVGGFMLIYNPPLLDILPLYVVFMLASPLLLQRGLACGWQGILGASVALWLGAQFDLGRAVYEGIVALTGLPVPFHQTGAFELFGWQFLWVLGLGLGANQAAASEPLRWPRWLVGLALAIAAAGLVARHAVGQTPGVAALDIGFDKWHLGPLRLIDFFALLALAMRYGPALAARLPRLRPLELLGAASLPVFCAHLVVTLLALALAGAPRSDRPLAVDLAILGVGFAALYAVALVSQRIDRHGRPALTADARR